jgi:hypothetical protein
MKLRTKPRANGYYTPELKGTRRGGASVSRGTKQICLAIGDNEGWFLNRSEAPRTAIRENMRDGFWS